MSIPTNGPTDVSDAMIERVAKMLCAADGPPGIGDYRWRMADDLRHGAYLIKARAVVDVVLDELGRSTDIAHPNS